MKNCTPSFFQCMKHKCNARTDKCEDPLANHYIKKLIWARHAPLIGICTDSLSPCGLTCWESWGSIGIWTRHACNGTEKDVPKETPILLCRYNRNRRRVPLEMECVLRASTWQGSSQSLHGQIMNKYKKNDFHTMSYIMVSPFPCCHPGRPSPPPLSPG